MTYVITQPCCADASCVVACPVNCIHPAPGEPGFAEAEMLYVDPETCVGCGACATACPADAIVPDWTLTDAQQPFLALNSAFYDAIPQGPRAPMWRMPAQRRVRRSGPFRVAVVGAGPAGLYAAAELLAHPEITVDVYDRLPAPHGLVRYGVAPDHQQTKQASGLFEYIESTPGFSYRLGVELGRDVRHDELLAAYHAVFYCVGAASDRTLGVPGEQLPGSVSATDVVGWYNGHPDKQDLDVRLDHERAVVVGNGNVALDVARILTRDPDRLAATDIAADALAALRSSAVREVVVLGRRGPAAASFTLPELIGLAGIADLNVVIDNGGAPIVSESPRDSARVALLAELAARPQRPGLRTVILRFHTRVTAILGEDRVRGIEIERGGQRETIEAGAVLRAIGYHGQPVDGLPYDARTGTVPNREGRVEPGVYVAGWIKRGPSGFIGSNKTCAQQSVTALLDDIDAGLITDPWVPAEDLLSRLRARTEVVDLAGWKEIDRVERARGKTAGAQRRKVTDRDELLTLAAHGASPPATRSLPWQRKSAVGSR
ncbi:FAD-dependent oxidoreductase [Epidermidibacterium keratini]|uniref:ferredoxin--NADP(+) reductase n=1 Tax=Epidermidibacterium keratini TaxID=1891644 RepID=A0A7L4YQK6_9ACTN|nr:FAD-dependent oxidoreductase [Epidermidibacterium keratini]QHC01436.1 FAD-dependent oxidoreductase [Epidermidibacterium keratini]